MPIRKHVGQITVFFLIAMSLAGLGACARSFTDAFNNSGDDFLDSGQTESFFRGFQVDPRSEDSAGPQATIAGDINDDGLVDIVSAWNQSQPIQIHLQHQTQGGDIWFETVTLAGNIPVVEVADVALADIDRDGGVDIVVQIRESLMAGASCLGGQPPPDDAEITSGAIVVYFAPEDLSITNQALAWEEVAIGTSLLAGAPSEEGSVAGFAGFVLGDLTGDGALDIVSGWNGACEDNQVLLFTNLGPLETRDGTWRVEPLPDNVSTEWLADVALADIDGDLDLDVVYTRPAAGTMNIRWLRNPNRDVIDDYHFTNGEWQVGTVGQLETGADEIAIADIDLDGILDVAVRSALGAIIQWYKGPKGPTSLPVRNIPWQVYTLGEFTTRSPQAIALGDVDADGIVDLLVSADGGLLWFGAANSDAVYDIWTSHVIIDEGLPDTTGGTPAPPPADPNAQPQPEPETTRIDKIIVSDIDGDGRLDVVAPLDRSAFSGLTDDALVWFQNTR